MNPGLVPGPMTRAAIRGVVRCPRCGTEGLWLVAHGAARSMVIALSERSARFLVRAFSRVDAPRMRTHRLLDDVVARVGASFRRVQIRPDGLGGIRATVELEGVGAVECTLEDGASLAHRHHLDVLVPAVLLVSHEPGAPPPCPLEEEGLPEAPARFRRSLERMRMEDFEGRGPAQT